MNKNTMNMVLKCKTPEACVALDNGGVSNVGTLPLPSGVNPPPTGGDGIVPETGFVIGVVPPAVLQLYGHKTENTQQTKTANTTINS